jgi:hypothetical protein
MANEGEARTTASSQRAKQQAPRSSAAMNMALENRRCAAGALLNA